jgi:hypothetical protein
MARAKSGGKSNYCYWSIADGEFALMAETMVASAQRVGVTTEFHIWSDEAIAGATVHPVGGFKKDHYLFKLEFLRDRVTALPHDYFVWLDADSYFVRDPGNMLRVLDGAPMHASLESDACGPNNIRTDWRGCPLPIYEHLMRSAGVRSKSIFNVNGGFWIVHRDVVKQFCELAFRFWEIGRQRGYLFTEEAPLAYATHMLCSNPSAHQLRRWTDVWVTDWQGTHGKRFPDGKPWIFRDYFTFEELEVNPAIVHIVGNKEKMIAEARSHRLRNAKAAKATPKKHGVTALFKPEPRRNDTTDRSATRVRRPGTR